MPQMFDTTVNEKMDTAFPEFHFEYVPTGKLDEEGLPEFNRVEMVKIITPGDQGNIPDLIVKEHHRVRFAKHYEAWQKGLEPPEDGMPLEEWPGINKAQLAQIRSRGIKTVEQLHAASEATMPVKLQSLIHKARVFIENAQGGKVAEEMRKEVTKLKRANTMLKKTIEEQKGVIKAYELQDRRESA